MKMFQDEEYVVMTKKNYFKSDLGEVFFYDDQQVEMGLADGKTPMTDEEVELHLNPPKSDEQILLEQQAEARQYLVDTDWYVTRSIETKVAIPKDVKVKRAAAREALQ